ncbi:MAG: hypothetical protein ACWGQW_05985 [bacterium]
MQGRAFQRGNVEGKNAGPLHVSADYSMGPADFVVIAESASAAVVVTLPSLAEAVPGAIYSVYAPAGATNDVSVFEKETAAELATYGDLDGAGDCLSVTPVGEIWVVVGSVLAA